MTDRDRTTEAGAAGTFREWADQLAAALSELSNEADSQFNEADILLAEYRGFVRGVEARTFVRPQESS